MSRVEEDREAQRIEQARIQRDVDAKRVASKNSEDNKQFVKLMASRQETNSKQDKQQSDSQQQQHHASEALMAKQGMAAASWGRNLAAKGDGRLLAKRAGNEEQANAGMVSRDEGRRKSAEMESKGSGSKGSSVSSKGGKNGDGQRQTSSKDKRDSTGEAAQQRIANVFGGIGQPLVAADGIGAKASQGSAGASTSNAHQIVDQIVKHVRTGVTALTHTPMIQIDLKDDVLAGSRLTISKSKDNVEGGIELNIQTLDADGNVARLFGNGDTVKDLVSQLGQHGIKLQKLTIDDKKIL